MFGHRTPVGLSSVVHLIHSYNDETPDPQLRRVRFRDSSGSESH